MRILHVSWEYPPLVYGGLGRHVHGLAEAQAAAGHEVVVLTQHPGRDGLADDEVVAGVRVLRVPHDPPAIGMSDLMAWVLALDHALTRGAHRLVRSWTPDVVHAHDWVVARTAAALVEATGAPLVVTMHATEAGRHQGWLPNDLSRAIHTTEWWLTHLARRVITCSAHMAWEVTRLFDLPDGTVDVIPNGIDLASWTVPADEVATARAELGGGGPLVVFVGRVEWEKGVHTLVEAVPRLRRRFPGLRVVVLGQGSQLEELEALARRLRVAGSVRFAGWRTDAALRAATAAADVVVVPSVYEPFGLVALEAAALGVPVVAAATGGLGELVEDGRTGLTFPALDAPALADAVTLMLRDDGLRREVTTEARRRLVREHSWTRIAERTVEAYRRALAQEGPAYDVASQPTVRDGNLLRDDA